MQFLTLWLNNVRNWSNALWKSGGVNTARFSKCFWPFFNLQHKRVTQVFFDKVNYIIDRLNCLQETFAAGKISLHVYRMHCLFLEYILLISRSEIVKTLTQSVKSALHFNNSLTKFRWRSQSYVIGIDSNKEEISLVHRNSKSFNINFTIWHRN